MSLPEFAAADIAARVTVDARQVMGIWTVRIVSTEDGPEGFTDEPYVLALEFHTLDLDGAGWKAAVVLDESYRRLRSALVDGYE